jgi:predicted NACHT family NTPase
MRWRLMTWRIPGHKVRGLTPVLLRIANYARAFEQDSTLHLIEYIERELTLRREFGRYLAQAIRDGACLVILDGLDEVTDPQLRMRVTDRIRAQIAGFSTNRYLVTSRIVGYDQSPLTREFLHATLQDLDERARERFIRLWYDAITDEVSDSSIASGTDDLITALRDKPQIARSAANPLLLTIIVLMHWRGTTLPSRRVQVYQNATDTLLEHWTAQRGVSLDAEESKVILAPIAHHILSSNVWRRGRAA